MTASRTLPFWSRPLAELHGELGSGPDGLVAAEAARRLRALGPNTVEEHPRRAVLAGLARRCADPLVAILLVAAAISGATGDSAGFAIIVATIGLSIALDFVQEHRAVRAAEALRRSVALRAEVRRDGRPAEIPAAELVPGDVVTLRAGDLVPADGRVTAARDFFVNNALMTGEPYPVEKHAQDGEATEPDAAPGALFMGSSVVSGTATMLVCATGGATRFGEIAADLARRAPPTAFERGMRRLGVLIVRTTAFMVLFVLLVNALEERALLDSFLFAVALAVGLTPELLPMVVTVTLSRGALRMAARRTIVKRLASIHNLGGMDVLCTDKTGTLTEARIALVRHVDLTGRDSEQVLRIAWLNSRFESGLRSPLDEAILAHGGVDLAGWSKVDEVPFDFERRRVSVLADDGARRLLLVKGAPEDILRLSTRYDAADGTVRALDAAALALAQARHDNLARDGFRVLAIAWREEARTRTDARVGDEADLVLAGFAAFLDPPKASAAAAVGALAAAGIAIKIVTGDNELVTRHLVGALKLSPGGLLTGAEIAGLDDSALAARVEQAGLFCRVTPAQKTRVIRALQARGHTVGFLGDGINDAPALHAADVGISVDDAADVAKAAADLILLDHDLSVVHDGVVEGRRTYANIMKYVMMGTSSNFGNMLSMAGAAVLLPFLPMLPVQILLNNLLYDLSEVGIPFDRVEPEELAKPHAWNMTALRDFMLVMGAISSAFDFLTFGVLLWLVEADAALFQTGWFMESMATQILVIFAIRTTRPALASPPDRRLAATSLVALAAALAIPFTAVGAWFGFVAPPAGAAGLLAILVVAYLVAVEAAKRSLVRRLLR